MDDPGGAAFYGPKISVQARDAIGRTWQMSTIQYDFNQPKGFELEYQAADGTRQQPVMIHSAKFGSIERFFGVLTEHYAGAFPAWLAPVQVVGIPVAEAFNDYMFDVVDQLKQMHHYAKNNVERLTAQWLSFDGDLKKLGQADRFESLMTKQAEMYGQLETDIAALEEIVAELTPAEEPEA